MKYSIIAIGLLLSFSSFATNVGGFNITSLPTASETYQEKVSDESYVKQASERIQMQCQQGRAKAQDYVKANGFKILATRGCENVKVENRNSEMSYDGIILTTSFEVLFK